MTLLISLGSFLLGLFALRRIYQMERAAASVLFQLTFVCFFAQHVAFGFAPLLMAIFDQGYTYQNLQGIFLYSDGIVPLEMVNLVSIYAALIGVRIAIIGRQPANRPQSMLLSDDHNKSTSEVLPAQNQALRMICYITLALHAVVFGLQQVSLPAILLYLFQVITPMVAATFYFWGLGWRQAGRGRWVFIVYASVFGLTSLSAGGRGYFLIGVLLFFLGYLQAHDWRLPRRDLAMIALAAVSLLWLITISENIRLLYRSRQPANLQEWMTRGSQLLSGVGLGGQEVESFDYAVFRSAATMTLFSPLDVIARTPQDVPYAGWSEDEWDLLFRGWFPAFGMRDIITAEIKGQLDVRDYGWVVDPTAPNPEDRNAAPMTFLADSWRRFGIIGIVVFPFILAVFLTRLSMLVEQSDHSIFRLIFGGSLVALIYYFSLWDILALVSYLPRRLLVCLIYTAVVYSVYLIHARLNRKLPSKSISVSRLP